MWCFCACHVELLAGCWDLSGLVILKVPLVWALDNYTTVKGASYPSIQVLLKIRTAGVCVLCV